MEAPRRRHVQQVDYKAVWEATYQRTKRSKRATTHRYRGEAQHVSDSDLRRMAEGDHGNRKSWQTNTLAACIQLCETPGAVLCLTKGTTVCCPRCVRVSLDRGADPQVMLNHVIRYMYHVTSDVSDILTPLFQAGAVLPTRPEPWYVEWSTYRGDTPRSTLFDRAATIACLAARVKTHGRDTADRGLSQETSAAFKKEYCAALELNSAFVPVREARRKQIWAQAMAQTGQSLGHWRTQNTVAFLIKQDMQRRAGVSEEELFQAEVDRAGRQAFAHFSRQAAKDKAERAIKKAERTIKKAEHAWVERNQKWARYGWCIVPLAIVTMMAMSYLLGGISRIGFMVVFLTGWPAAIPMSTPWSAPLSDIVNATNDDLRVFEGCKRYSVGWYIFSLIVLILCDIMISNDAEENLRIYLSDGMLGTFVGFCCLVGAFIVFFCLVFRHPREHFLRL